VIIATAISELDALDVDLALLEELDELLPHAARLTAIAAVRPTDKNFFIIFLHAYSLTLRPLYVIAFPFSTPFDLKST
jgi:hypothetical protein